MKRYKGTRKWFARNRQHISHNLSWFSLSTRTAERSPNSHHAPHLHLAAPPGSFAKQVRSWSRYRHLFTMGANWSKWRPRMFCMPRCSAWSPLPSPWSTTYVGCPSWLPSPSSFYVRWAPPWICASLYGQLSFSNCNPTMKLDMLLFHVFYQAQSHLSCCNCMTYDRPILATPGKLYRAACKCASWLTEG